MPKKPPLELQTTTLWDYPSQHYGNTVQGDPNYVGATPSYIIWNLLQRYTKEGEVVVDPMCGSGTTLDVAKDLGRTGRGFDLAPYRPDIEQADARRLPLKDGLADFVFVDPPYSTHVDYSDHPDCIGKLHALEGEYWDAMAGVVSEIARILKPGGHMALYVSDSRRKNGTVIPIGFYLYGMLLDHFIPVDVVAVVRRHKSLNRPRWHREAARENFFLRGFNHLFIMRKEPQAPPKKSRKGGQGHKRNR